MVTNDFTLELLTLSGNKPCLSLLCILSEGSYLCSGSLRTWQACIHHEHVSMDAQHAGIFPCLKRTGKNLSIIPATSHRSKAKI